jgi:hypothetical protein
MLRGLVGIHAPTSSLPTRPGAKRETDCQTRFALRSAGSVFLFVAPLGCPAVCLGQPGVPENDQLPMPPLREA